MTTAGWQRTTRRRFLVGAGAAAALAVTPRLVRGPGLTGELLGSDGPLPQPFEAPLPIPPVLTGDEIEIVARRGAIEVLPGSRAPIGGFDGRFPGPTIESRSGRAIKVRHRNALDHPIAVHLHGGRTPSEHDGFPTDLVPPGGERVYEYPLEQRAATLWYHDHAMDRTAPHVYRGLAGFHIVRDDEEDALPLPRGDRELPLMIADRSIDRDGRLVYPHGNRDFVEGVLGDVVLVNGAPWPVHEVDGARHRLRLLNASNARRYELELDPPLELVRIGTDGGLLERPLPQRRIVLAPAERADVVVDFGALRPGAHATLRDRIGAGPVMRFRIARRAGDDSIVPARLSRIERLDRRDATVTRELRFERGGPGWVIDGRPFDADRIDLRPELNGTELWRVTSDLHHPVHVHLAHFQVQGAELAWKDTVDLLPGQTAELLLRFDGYPGRYVLHCHNLEHEDMAMMAAFEVVTDGQAAAGSGRSARSRASSPLLCRVPRRIA